MAEKTPELTQEEHHLETGKTEQTTERIDEKDGYVLDARQLENEKGVSEGALKTAKDGHTVLIPQPSEDPQDPLNWTVSKKHVILAVMSASAFIADYGSAMGAVTVLPQALEWNKSQNTVQHVLVGNIFVLGAAGLIIVAISSYFGRLPVLMYCLAGSVGTGAWCAAASSYQSFFAARIFNGIFLSVAASGGLMFIQDIFFFHEHPRKINLWSGAIILSPYLGPFTAAFVIWKTTWRWAYWILTILTAICFLLVIFFMDETYYNREIASSADTYTPAPKARSKARIKKHVSRLLGIEQCRSRQLRSTFTQALIRPVIAITKIPVLLIVINYMIVVAWVIGVNTAISIWLTNFYHFSPKGLGLFYFAGITGAILGDIIGHWLHDFVGAVYAKYHGGRIHPEARLITTWLSLPLMVAGLVVMAFALQRHWHYIIIAVFWSIQIVGYMIDTTAINAYLLDAYPEGSGEVGAWVTLARTMGGFMATYVQLPWVTKEGLEKALGIQAGITVAAWVFILFLQVYGKRIRHLQGPMWKYH